jgi:UDP-N-acetylmuramoylalanine-D-glutamate ligase
VMRELGLAVADDDAAMAELAQGFQALPSRLTSVGSVGGVEFVDDSLSTNVLPTVAAVRSFADRRLALLVGGYDRGIDYDDLAIALREREVPMLVIGIPDNGPHVIERMRALGVSERVDTAVAESIEAAVRAGFEWLDDDGVVLLSPAAASFGRYGDYRERAAAFVAAMGECRGDERPDRA